MDLELAGKRAIVSGGSRGLGFSTAVKLAAEGASVALVSRNKNDLDEAVARLQAAVPGATVLAAPADTTDDASVHAMVEAVVAAWGSVDILVNAAAQPAGGPSPALQDLTDDQVTRDFDTKVMGYLRTARAVAPHMTAQGAGRIVNISGLNARKTGSIPGTIRNVAVSALTANLADELGPHGIGVTVVHPAMVDTDRIAPMVAAKAEAAGTSEDDVRAELGAGASLRRLMTADEVADVVVFLASPKAVAITGDAVAVGGGNRGNVHY